MKILLTALFILLSVPAHAEGPLVRFDISAQPLAGALQTLADQADLQILFTVADVQTHRAPSIAGRMSSEAALQKLLAGTSLEYVHNGDVVVVRERAITKSAALNGEGQGSALLLAQGQEPGEPANAPRPPSVKSTESPSPNASATDDGNDEELGTMVVTGSLIRGAQVASPLVVISRPEIERTGYTTLQQVIDRLPQNYGGGDSEGTVLAPGSASLNVAMGSSVNLRGLGSDSTLVLLNGHRLAPAAYGQFVDISMIPLTAIDRIEVLTDGASATYGSDAVAGVVNIHLRKDYEGAETRLKGGSVTEGHLDEYQAGQTIGQRWDTGNVLLTYEYFKRGNLDSNERDFSQPALDPYDLLAEQERHSVLTNLTQALSTSTRLEATALYSERDALWQQANFFTGVPQRYPTQSRQASASLSAIHEFGATWQTALDVSYGRNTTDRDVITPMGTAPAERNELAITSAELTLDGSPFSLRDEPVRVALGAAWRTEKYDQHRAGRPVRERDVSAAFLETIVPLLASSSDHSLELSLAARYEDYSDFGTTTNPKAGLVWEPTSSLRLRSTWGTSFRAPIHNELDDSNVTPVLLNLPDPTAADGTTLSMFLNGNNPNLQPEESATYTVGFDWQPASLPRTQLSLTYFNTEFEDRIVQPLPGAEFFSIFSQEEIYASIITRDPDDAFIAELAAHPRFQNGFGPFVPADVRAYFDRSLQNLSLTDVSGIDLAASIDFDTPIGELRTGLTGTYLLEFTDRVSATAPENDVLDTAYHPIDLRLRASIAWTRGAWNANLYVNHADGYSNVTVTPNAAVDSWTTLDLQLAYTVPWLDGVRIALAAQNVLDEDPPFLSSPLALFAVGFDETNASGLGRFLSLGVTTNW